MPDNFERIPNPPERDANWEDIQWKIKQGLEKLEQTDKTEAVVLRQEYKRLHQEFEHNKNLRFAFFSEVLGLKKRGIEPDNKLKLDLEAAQARAMATYYRLIAFADQKLGLKFDPNIPPY